MESDLLWVTPDEGSPEDIACQLNQRRVAQVTGIVLSKDELTVLVVLLKDPEESLAVVLASSHDLLIPLVKIFIQDITGAKSSRSC